MKFTCKLRRGRLDRRILLAVLVLLFFPVLLLEFGTTAMLQREVERIIVQSSLQLGGQLTLSLREALASSLSYLERVATGSDIRNLNRNLAGDVLAIARERREEFEQLLLVDADGSLVADSSVDEGGRKLLEEDFPRERLDEISPNQGKVFTGRVSNQLYPVWPVRDASDNLVGFLVASIRPRIVRFWLDGRSLGTGEQVFLTTRAMKIIYGNGDWPESSLDTLLKLPWGAYEWRNGYARLVTRLPVVGHDLQLVIFRNAREAFGLVRELRGQLLLTVIFGVLLAFTVGWYSGRRDSDGEVENSVSGSAALPPEIRKDSLIAAALSRSATAVSVDTLLQEILHEVIEHFHLERASVMLVDEETDELLLRAVRICDLQTGEQTDAEFVRRIRLFQGDGIAGQVAREGRPMLVAEGARDSRFKAYDTETGLNETVRGLITVPLKDSDRVIGVLNAVNPREAEDFNEESLKELERLGQITGKLTESLFRLEAVVVDPQSGMRSEGWLRRHLQRERASARRQGVPFCLLLVRVDGFAELETDNSVNLEILLHGLFRQLGEELRGAIPGRYRERHQCLIVLPPQSTPQWQQQLQIVHKALVEKEFPAGGRSCQVALSFALVCSTDPLDLVAGLLRGLEITLDQCTASGGNCLRVHGQEVEV